MLLVGPSAPLAFLAKEHLQEMLFIGPLALLAYRPFGLLAKEHLSEMLFIWPLALLVSRPFGLFGQGTSARDVGYLGSGPIGL